MRGIILLVSGIKSPVISRSHPGLGFSRLRTSFKLFDDDAALILHTEEDLQTLIDQTYKELFLSECVRSILSPGKIAPNPDIPSIFGLISQRCLHCGKERMDINYQLSNCSREALKNRTFNHNRCCAKHSIIFRNHHNATFFCKFAALEVVIALQKLPTF